MPRSNLFQYSVGNYIVRACVAGRMLGPTQWEGEEWGGVKGGQARRAGLALPGGHRMPSQRRSCMWLFSQADAGLHVGKELADVEVVHGGHLQHVAPAVLVDVAEVAGAL